MQFAADEHVAQAARRKNEKPSIRRDGGGHDDLRSDISGEYNSAQIALGQARLERLTAIAEFRRLPSTAW